MKVFRGLLALLGCLAMLGTPAARAADSVTVGTVGSASANIWPVFIGQKKGFFKEENLDVEIVDHPVDLRSGRGRRRPQ